MKAYCTQNNGDCETCSLSSYGRDCKNVKIPGGARKKAQQTPAEYSKAYYRGKKAGIKEARDPAYQAGLEQGRSEAVELATSEAVEQAFHEGLKAGLEQALEQSDSQDWEFASADIDGFGGGDDADGDRCYQ